MTACEAYINIRSADFVTDFQMITFAIALLEGTAAVWGREINEGILSGIYTQANYNWANFRAEFMMQFDDPDARATAYRNFKKLNQGNKTVTDYSVEFLKYATQLGYGQTALIDAFVKGFNPRLKDAWARELNRPNNLAGIQGWAIQVDNRMRARDEERREEKARQPTTSIPRENPARVPFRNRFTPAPAYNTSYNPPRNQPVT